MEGRWTSWLYEKAIRYLERYLESIELPPNTCLLCNFLSGLRVSPPTAKGLLIGLVDWSTGTLPTSRTTDTTMQPSSQSPPLAIKPPLRQERILASHIPTTAMPVRTTVVDGNDDTVLFSFLATGTNKTFGASSSSASSGASASFAV